MTKINYVGKCLLVKTGSNKNSRARSSHEDLSKKILVVGDLHLGYEEHLNKTGVFVSRMMFEEMIKYLEKVFSVIDGEVDEVVLLGDVKHDFGSVLKQEWNDVLGLFDYLEKKTGKGGKIIITKGNHDNILEPICRRRNRVLLRDFYIVGDICFCHGDKIFQKMNEKKIKFWIVGHGHPAVKISDGVKTEKFKCFFAGKYKGREIVIVPSFFSYSEGSDPRENELGMAWNFNLNKFHVKIVSEDSLDVFDFGKLGDIK